MSVCIFTIVARNYLPLALTLADSVARHHPEAQMHIYVVDGLDGLPAASYAHTLTGLDSVLGPEFDALRFQYNITEFCTSVKPMLFARLLAQTQAELVYYLDPDTWLFGRLDPIHQAAPDASIFLTPHLLHCRPDGDHAYPEYKHLWEGIFNLGFCAVRRSTTTDRFLAWWDKRLREYCYADHFDGLHTDQKWMDYVPAYFGEHLHIVRQQGVNVAHWNLDERTLEKGPSDTYTVSGEALLLFHFSGFDFAGESLTRHVETQSQQRYASPALQALSSSYREAVKKNGYADHIRLSYRYNYFDNGQPISPLQRRLYRALGPSGGAASPFAHGGSFYQTLSRRGLLDFSPAALRGHSAATLPQVGRLTRWAQAGLRVFLRCFGASRYAYLLKFFNKFARPENHVFLLEDKAEHGQR
ncbi:MAG: hypothetical protein JO006_10010 [Paucibacter sp.]|nr:hypothetical protein [Roseateles sp.]